MALTSIQQATSLPPREAPAKSSQRRKPQHDRALAKSIAEPVKRTVQKKIKTLKAKPIIHMAAATGSQAVLEVLSKFIS